MLHHISVAVNNSAQVAQVLAEAIGGQSFPFPPHPGSYFVIAGDEFCTAIELYPATTKLIPGGEDVVFAKTSNSPHYLSVHAAISVPTSQAQIEAIGQREGWLVRVCDRGLLPAAKLEFPDSSAQCADRLAPNFPAHCCIRGLIWILRQRHLPNFDRALNCSSLIAIDALLHQSGRIDRYQAASRMGAIAVSIKLRTNSNPNRFNC